MRYLFVVCFSLFACQSKPVPPVSETPSTRAEPVDHVDNSATRYAESLKTDVQKARVSAEKANVAIAAEKERMSQAQEATQ